MIARIVVLNMTGNSGNYKHHKFELIRNTCFDDTCPTLPKTVELPELCVISRVLRVKKLVQ